MARNFSNTSKTEDLEWKKLRHFKGDRSSFYVKHDTFNAPPPAPERNQSYGGKCENTCNAPSVTDSTQTDTISEAATEMVEQQSATKCPPSPNIEQSVTEICPANASHQTVSSQSHISNVLQNSTSTQSINSVLSTCSSHALPLPVKAGWYDDSEAASEASVSTVPTSNISMTIPDTPGVLSPISYSLLSLNPQQAKSLHSGFNLVCYLLQPF